MSEEALAERLAAVERALADGDDAADGTASPDSAGRLDDLEERVAELEAAVQAVRGYVGSVKHVNDDVADRADAAMARAAAVERALEARGVDGSRRNRRENPATQEPGGGPLVDAAGALADDPVGSEAGGCPRCGGARDGRGPDRPAGRRDRDPAPTDDRSDRDPDQCREGRPDDDGDRARDPTRPPGRGPRGVGHRRLGAEDAESDGGLLARLGELL